MTETLTALPGALLLLAAMLAIVWSLAAAAGLNDLAAWATKRVKAWAARRRACRDLRAYPPRWRS